MKTPEEIKKGLECCMVEECYGEKENCPYTADPALCVGVMCEDALAYIQQLEARVLRWIPVEERLPKHGAIVFCYTKYFYEVLQWDDDAEQWVGQYSVNAKHYVTHWMPIPEPPEEVQREV